MQSKKPLNIQKTILKRLIELIKRPLLQYMDILADTLKSLDNSSFKFNEKAQLDHAIEKLEHSFSTIKKSVACCSDINGISTIYNESIQFLKQFDSLDDQSLLLDFQPLIIKFNHFYDFFQSFRIVNDIYEKLFNEVDNQWDLNLQKEIQWYITFQNKLLEKLLSESKKVTNQYDDQPLNYRPRFHRHSCYVKDVYQ